jgi:P4 family phage/plasmid primase-like protien
MKSTVIIPDLVEMPSWLNDSERNGNYIVLQNGIIHLESLIYNKEGSFLKHSSEYFSGNLLPYEYIPNARCEKWMDFLNEVQPDPIIQGLLQEFFGYCLIHDTSLHKFLLLTGEGANGKSVLCSTLSSVLGYENVSTISLEMFNGRYSLIATLGKLANVVSEIGEIDKSAEGYLKAFVSGDRMPFEQKYKPVFTAKPTARLVFATNTLPRFVDKSEGLWRRMLIVPFNVVIAEEKQKVSLEDELRMELPGILNWALTGLIRLRERGKFIQPDASKTAKTEYQLEMNPAKAFLQDCCEVDVQSEVLIGNIYYAYNEYCKNGGFIAMNSANFGKEILRAFPNCKKQRKRVNGVKVAFYMGIRLSEALCVNPEPEFTPEMMTELDSWT